LAVFSLVLLDHVVVVVPATVITVLSSAIVTLLVLLLLVVLRLVVAVAVGGSAASVSGGRVGVGTASHASSPAVLSAVVAVPLLNVVVHELVVLDVGVDFGESPVGIAPRKPVNVLVLHELVAVNHPLGVVCCHTHLGVN